MTGFDPNAEGWLDRVAERIRGYGEPRAVVAFSGGVDSAVVTAVAARALGSEAVTAATAVSPSYPAGELDQARALAASIGVRHHAVRTAEVEREAYARNDADRCFHCKAEVYATLRRLAASERGEGVVLLSGTNADDVLDDRPGLRAAAPFGVRDPLLEEGATKQVVRNMARMLGLVVAEKPALACLSSRVALGIRITPELLVRIDRAERAIRSLGFDPVRVRHLGRRASVEVVPTEVERLRHDPRLPQALAEISSLGWPAVDVDPNGYRPGSVSRTIPLAMGTTGRV